MCALLFLLVIKFLIVFEVLVTVLIPRLFKFFSFVVELMDKIIHLRNELLFEKLLFVIFVEHLRL